jgi:hydroxysqualene dehydroxylase
VTAVAVIGAGYAGLAAAVELAQNDIPVTVFESAHELGGRARRVDIEGNALDNGQHILVGAYRELLRLQELTGVVLSAAYLRTPLNLEMHATFRLRAPWSGRTGLVAAFILARGLPWRDRIAAARMVLALRRVGFRLDQDRTVRAFLADSRQPDAVCRLLWEPLCLAALNTPAEEASAQVFANILRDTLDGPSGASDLLLPRIDLSALFPTPAAAFVTARGGIIHTGATVRTLQREGDAWRISAARSPYTAVIVATSPVGALRLLPRECEVDRLAIGGLTQQPITTVYAQYPASVRLGRAMVGLPGERTHAQWVFDRSALGGPAGLLAAVISAARREEDIAHDKLAAIVVRELDAAFGPLPTPRWTQVISERRATFSCTPNLVRPANATAAPGLFLAGDYTASDYPGTLESAVRSGIAAAAHALDWVSTRRVSATPPQHHLGDQRP